MDPSLLALYSILYTTMGLVGGGVAATCAEHCAGQEDSKLTRDSTAFIGGVGGVLWPLTLLVVVTYGLVVLASTIPTGLRAFGRGARDTYRLVRPVRAALPKATVRRPR